MSEKLFGERWDAFFWQKVHFFKHCCGWVVDSPLYCCGPFWTHQIYTFSQLLCHLWAFSSIFMTDMGLDTLSECSQCVPAMFWCPKSYVAGAENHLSSKKCTFSNIIVDSCESSKYTLSDSFLGVFSGKILTLGRNGLIRVVERKWRVSGTCIMDDHMPQEKHVLTYNCELTLFLWPPKFKKITT